MHLHHDFSSHHKKQKIHSDYFIEILMTQIRWKHVRERFEQSLAIPRAINLRGGSSDLNMLTLAASGRHGFGYQGAQRLGFGHDLDLSLHVSDKIWGTGTGRHTGRVNTDAPSLEHGQAGPDIIERHVEYPGVGLSVHESCWRDLSGTHLWRAQWTREAYRPHAPGLKCNGQIQVQSHWILELNQSTKWSFEPIENGLSLHFEAPLNLNLSIMCPQAEILLAQGYEPELQRLVDDGNSTLRDAFQRAGFVLPEAGQNHESSHLILPIRWSLNTREEREVFVSFQPSHIENSLGTTPAAWPSSMIELEAHWDAYFSQHLPSPTEDKTTPTIDLDIAPEAPSQYLDAKGHPHTQITRAATRGVQTPWLYPEDLAYSKCLWLTQHCERLDPSWGPTLTETYTCSYSGTFAWSAPVACWYFRNHGQDEYEGAPRAIWDCYRQMQGDNGSLPCYIGFNMPKGEPDHSQTQIPQYAWGVWQEYRHNQDESWLKQWLPCLSRYADFMEAKDRQYLNLGLWCQTHYYDGIDMFPTVDGLVLRGAPFLYSACFAAEQVRFYDAMARICDVVQPDQAEHWTQKKQAAHRAIIQHLWDSERQWFGDILEDGTRETIVGINGLFAITYGLQPKGTPNEIIREHLKSLIVPYGVATVSPKEKRYCERFFWRGPVWPASCLYAMGAAFHYAPDLIPALREAIVRFALAQPGIFECLEGHSGRIARYDEGTSVMPGVSSVVGSYAICAALDIARGEDLFRL